MSDLEWLARTRESEVAVFERNAIGNGPQRGPPVEPTGDGTCARCSLTPCCRYPLERHRSQRWLQGHVTGRWVKVLAEALAWSLVPGREGLSGLPHDKKSARSGSRKGWSIYPPFPMAVPHLKVVSMSRCVLFGKLFGHSYHLAHR